MRNRLWFLVAYFSVGLFCIHTEIVIKEITVCRMWSIVIHNWFAVICSLWHLMCGRSLNDLRSLMSNLQPFRIDLWLLWRSALFRPTGNYKDIIQHCLWVDATCNLRLPGPVSTRTVDWNRFVNFLDRMSLPSLCQHLCWAGLITKMPC